MAFAEKKGRGKYSEMYPAGNFMFRNTRIRCEISSKLTTKTPE